MKPLLCVSELTGRVYCVTRYTRGPNGQIVAAAKTDVTDQVGQIIAGYELGEGGALTPKPAVVMAAEAITASEPDGR